MAYDSSYAPFGEQYSGGGSFSFYDFTGQQQWTTSGLDDFLFRRYHPVQGRWISPDPAGLAAVDITNPQTWNRYAYVANNPLSNIDPLGLENCDDDGTLCDGANEDGVDGTSPGGGGDPCAYDACVVAPPPDPVSPVDTGVNQSSGVNLGLNVILWNIGAYRLGKAANNGTSQTPCSSAGNAPSPRQYQAMGYVAQASWLFGPGVGGLSNAGTLAMFKRGLPLDAQVIYGGSQAYANYSYGVFMSAAGYPLNFALWGANAYASSQSSYPQNTPMDPNYPSTPASNVANITAGFNAQQNGTLCHK